MIYKSAMNDGKHVFVFGSNLGGQIAPMFEDAPSNCVLPEGFAKPCEAKKAR